MWIQIDQQHFLAVICQIRAEVDRCGRLAHAAFLVSQGVDARHKILIYLHHTGFDLILGRDACQTRAGDGYGAELGSEAGCLPGVARRV